MKPMLGCVSNYLNESKLDGISEKVIHVSGIQQLCVNEIEFLVVFNPSGLLFTLFGRIICLWYVILFSIEMELSIFSI